MLDAYDEWYHNDYVYDMIFRQILKDSFCILSSRYIEIDNGLMNVELLGFADRSLDYYLTTLANDSMVAQSVSDLWSKYPSVRSMCTLPLHLAMVVFIMRHAGSESMPNIQTRAQIYTAFMNMTIKHYKASRHPSWNTISLRHCILNVTTESDNDLDLCNAFRALQNVAFEMLFKHRHLFSDHPEIQRNLKTLNFLGIKVEPSTSDQVRYSFSHPTFLEFFAVLHLLTLTQNEQLRFINLYGRECKNNLVTLYFELIADLYPDSIPQAAAVIKISATQVNYWKTFPAVCIFTFDHRFLETVEKVTHTWSDSELTSFLKTNGIVVNGSLCVHDLQDLNFLKAVLKRAVIHRLQFRGSNDCMKYIITLEDWSQSLTGVYLDAVHKCFASNYTHCTSFNSLTALRVEYLTSQSTTCTVTSQLFNFIRDYLPNLSLFHMHISVIESLLELNNETNLLTRVHTEVTIPVTNDNCETFSFLSELLPRTKGIHFISHCMNLYNIDVENMLKLDTRLDEHFRASTLPQYQTITLVGNIPFLPKILFGQRELRHLHLNKVNKKWIDVHSLLEWIKSNPNLETLQISKADFDFEEMKVKALSNFLPSTLLGLNLDGNNLTDNVINVLSQNLKHLHKFNYLKHLHKFNYFSLGDNKITDIGAAVIANVLKSNEHFHFLDLSNNPNAISDQYFGDLAQLTRLKYLAFNGRAVHDTFLSELLQNLPEIQSLHLSKKHRDSSWLMNSSRISVHRLNAPEPSYTIKLRMSPDYIDCYPVTASTSYSVTSIAPNTDCHLIVMLIICYTVWVIIMYVNFVLKNSCDSE